MVKRSPVIGHEVSGAESVPQRECIIERQVATAIGWLPPRSVTNRQHCQIEGASPLVDALRHHAVAVRRKSRIAGEETRRTVILEQVHVGRASPSVHSVPAAQVLRCRRREPYPPYLDRITRRDRFRLTIAHAAQPSHHRRWCVHRHVGRQLTQRRKAQMVGVRMRHQHRVERWKVLQRDPGRRHAPKKARERCVEVGIGEHPHPPELQQQRRMANVRDAHEGCPYSKEVRDVGGQPCLLRLAPLILASRAMYAQP